jgi:DNA-binding transcriptional regulator YdaS (Cro superfamily)
MQATELIEAMGGNSACARICGVKPPSVSEWITNNKIPKYPHILLSVAAEGAGVAKRQDLRPNDWQKIWPELAEQTNSAVA